MEQFREKLLRGMRERGLSEAFAEQVYNQIRGFGEYGFPESHAASFALLVYVSAWLKHHYPAAFCAALLNSQPMGFYAPAQLVRDAVAHGVQVLPVDVNASDWDCTLENLECGIWDLEFEEKVPQTQIPDSKSQIPNCLRLGLRMIVGLPQRAGEAIMAARREGPFASVADFTRRSRLSKSVVERLAAADAFQSLALPRRAALWQAIGQDHRRADHPLLANQEEDERPPAALAQLTQQEEVFADYRTAGLSLRAHPISFYRQQLADLGAVPAESLARWKHNSRVCVAGLVLMRQRPSTARGITFITLEDETGVANLVIRVQIWERFYEVARRASSMIVDGVLERKGQVIHVVAHRLRDLAKELKRLQELRLRSRDFR
jgi:error-prone DNA polymerase